MGVQKFRKFRDGCREGEVEVVCKREKYRPHYDLMIGVDEFDDEIGNASDDEGNYAEYVEQRGMHNEPLKVSLGS